jgi:hypothetical protein
MDTIISFYCLLVSKIKEQPFHCYGSDVQVMFMVLIAAMPQAVRDGRFFLFFPPHQALYCVTLTFWHLNLAFKF